MKLHRLVYLITVSWAISTTVRGDGDPSPSEYSTNETRTYDGYEIFRNRYKSRVNPCNNFYDHVCDGQKGEHYLNSRSRISREIVELLKNIQPGDMEALKKAKEFQDACTKADAIRSRGIKPIHRLLSDNGLWPITPLSDKWNNKSRSWLEMHENFVKHTGKPILFDVTAAIDRRNTSVHILSLGVPAGLSLITDDETFFLLVNEVNKFREFNDQYADLLADYEGVTGFANELVKLAINLDEDCTDNHHDLRITTIEELQNDWDAAVPKTSNYSISWLKVINDRFEGTGIVVNASEKIALKPAAFVENFSRLLMNTPKQTIVNYVYTKVIEDYRFAVDPDCGISGIGTLYDTTPEGSITIHKMIHAVAYIYVKEHLSVQSKTAALEIVQNLKDEIKREIRECTWLDEATKLAAQKKLDAIRDVLGYPEWYDEPGKIDEYYRELTVGPDCFENHLAYNKFMTKKQLSKLRSLVDETEINFRWEKPYFPNVDYEPRSNVLGITQALLQLPYFDYERPSVLNYGTLGAFAGREISRAFDTLGRLVDEAGIKRKWWSQSAIDTFKTKAQCFVTQYDKYTVNIQNETLHVNSTETQASNIADTIGFRAGLRAYQRLRNNGKINNQKIQLLNDFTDEQLYFYELAYMFCKPNQYIDTGSMTALSPDEIRIIGAVSNMQEFADAFHCPPGSPMNPPEKCLIWD